MWVRIKAWYLAVHNTFHSSEVILWGRIQVALGVVAGVLVSTDLSAFFDSPKVLTGYLLMNGLATEVLRRNRTIEMQDGSLVPDTTVAVVSSAPPPTGKAM